MLKTHATRLWFVCGSIVALRFADTITTLIYYFQAIAFEQAKGIMITDPAAFYASLESNRFVASWGPIGAVIAAVVLSSFAVLFTSQARRFGSKGQQVAWAVLFGAALIATWPVINNLLVIFAGPF